MLRVRGKAYVIDQQGLRALGVVAMLVSLGALATGAFLVRGELASIESSLIEARRPAVYEARMAQAMQGARAFPMHLSDVQDAIGDGNRTLAALLLAQLDAEFGRVSTAVAEANPPPEWRDFHGRLVHLLGHVRSALDLAAACLEEGGDSAHTCERAHRAWAVAIEDGRRLAMDFGSESRRMGWQ